MTNEYLKPTGGRFYSWLRAQRLRDDSVGAVSRDAFWDNSAPKQSDTKQDWVRYYGSRALKTFHEGVEQAWKEFEVTLHDD